MDKSEPVNELVAKLLLKLLTSWYTTQALLLLTRLQI